MLLYEGPMGKLDKYIFWQVASAAFMTVALFVFVLVLGNVFKEVLGDLLAGRMSFTFFLKVVALIIPGVIPYSLPMGMLTGILLVFGRMSAQSEITAMKACGHSIFAMTAPVFLLSILACVVSFFINFAGIQNALSLSAAALTGSLLLLAAMPPIHLLAPTVFIFGLTLGCVEVGGNIYGTHLEKTTKRILLPSMHGCYSLGEIIALAIICALIFLKFSIFAGQ